MFKFIHIFLFFLSISTLSSCGYNSLTSQEIQSSKKGRSFWQWSSPKGTYDIHFIEKGSGSKNILLLHGFGASTYSWRYLIDPLAEAGYHVWAMDLLGFGFSDKPLDASYDLTFFQSQINAFMQEKDISPAIVIGNSMGGGLALNTAVSQPEKVKSLILIDALGYPISLPIPLEIGNMLGSLSKYIPAKFLVKQALQNVMYDPSKITEEQIDAYATPLQMPGGPEAAYTALKHFNKKQLEDLSQHYKDLHIPVLVIWGEKDTWIPLDNYEHFLRDFPQAQKALILNCGHIPQEECPQEVNKAILEFLKQ